jgi:hypothetical protein
LGNPNVFNNNRFIATPNPPNDFMSVISQETISDVWLVPANAQKIYQQTEFSVILNSNLYSESVIDSSSQLKVNDSSSNHFILNLESLNPGYYRIFVKINGSMFWENIFIPDSGFQIEDVFDYWE